MKKVYRTIIRIIVFFGVYFPLFMIPFSLEMNFLTPVVVLVSFFISKPVTKYIVSKENFIHLSNLAIFDTKNKSEAKK